MPDLTELLQRSSGTEPNLRDIGASILRANVERTSVGQQLDTMQNQRSDLAQRGFQNELSLMEYQWQQTQAAAEAGNAQAKNAMDTFQSVAADYAPEDRARLWATWTGGGDDSLTSLYGAVESLGLEPVTDENKGPTSVQEYNQAKAEGFQGNYMQFLNEKASASRSQTTVNVNTGDSSSKWGDAPTGYYFGMDPDTGEVAERTVTLEDGSQVQQPVLVPAGETLTRSTQEELKGNAAAARENIGALTSALDMLKNVPEATGISGLLIEEGGGLLQQLDNIIGTDMADNLGVEEVTQFRTTVGSLLGRYIPTITGDDSGRYSDRDMQRAQQVSRIDATTASPQQLAAALKTLLEIERNGLVNDNARLDGVNFNVTTEEGRANYIENLARKYMEDGMSQEEAVTKAAGELRTNYAKWSSL